MKTNDSYNYSYYPVKIYEETVFSNDYKYTFKLNSESNINCEHSKIYSIGIILRASGNKVYGNQASGNQASGNHIYSYSFALYPENSNPKGSIDLNNNHLY